MKRNNDRLSDNSSVEFSRRKFLKSAAGGSAVMAAAVALPVEGLPIGNGPATRANGPVDEILLRYGSEFGDVRVKD